MPSVHRCLLFLLLPAAIFADGGAVQARHESGPFVITVFTSPSPVVAGPLDVSVMIQDRVTLVPILDAAVIIELHQTRSSTAISTVATREQAQNKLLYAAQVNLPSEGIWQYKVTVSRTGSEAGIAGQFTAGPSRPGVASYWTYIALAPALIALIILHQVLAGAARAGRGRSTP